MAKKKPKKVQKEKIKRIESDAPTAVIAPSDYVHIYRGNTTNLGTKSPKSGKKLIKRIPSDAPTAIIAPSDYVHIFQGKKVAIQPNNYRLPSGSPLMNTKRVRSDAPTIAIAPSDYIHIYKANTKDNRFAPPPKQSAYSQYQSTKTSAKMRQKQQKMTDDVPQGLVDQIEDFIAGLPKDYTLD